ncbi:MAG TPA: DUF2946 family protein [Tepidisphaeraceae bacterium]|jgi:hypothetical protein|nr:DUF2946 family protein [Tepidisphaeraceae bacterium]
MFYRPLKFLLLACILAWTSGASQYAHERLEHSGHVEAAACCDADGQADNCPADHHHKHPAPDDHDDCPTCQLLAHMAADPVAPPVVPCADLPSIPAFTLTDRRPPAVEFRCFAPIRGPPAVELRSA